ncbi:hypothetical protein DIPPA_00698 [Diplonema papillatum]|nr:hypothetical protein DIPPA_00698 [Diplonema papillatum]
MLATPPVARDLLPLRRATAEMVTSGPWFPGSVTCPDTSERAASVSSPAARTAPSGSREARGVYAVATPGRSPPAP